MADELPSGDKAVFTFLEMIAGAFAFAGVERLLDSKSTAVGAIACAISLVFFVAGIKWPRIKAKVSSRFAISLDRIANDSRYRIGAALLIALYVSLTMLAYVHSVRTDVDEYVMPRRLTDKQSNDLRGYLARSEPHSVTVATNMADEEALNYADDFVYAINKSGWSAELNDVNAVHITSGTGMGVYEQAPSPRPSDPKTNPTEILTQALINADVSMEGSAGGAVYTYPQYKLFLVVGHRPMAIGQKPPLLMRFGEWIMHLNDKTN